MSDRFLGQQIDTKFCVKLGKNIYVCMYVCMFILYYYSGYFHKYNGQSATELKSRHSFQEMAVLSLDSTSTDCLPYCEIFDGHHISFSDDRQLIITKVGGTSGLYKPRNMRQKLRLRSCSRRSSSMPP